MTTVDIGPHQYSTENAATQPNPDQKPEQNPGTTTNGSSNTTGNNSTGSNTTGAAASQNKTAPAAANAAKPAASTATIIPKTGDSQPIALYMILTLVGAFGFLGVYLCKRKQ